MNKRVTLSMSVLCLAFLFACYYLKFLHPEDFAVTISNERVLFLGDIIDNSPSLTYACAAVTSFVTYYLYCCACAGKSRLGFFGVLAIASTIVIVRVTSVWDVNVATGIQFASFMFLPHLTDGKLKNAAVVYTVHCVAQNLSLTIRDLPMYFTRVNSAVAIVAGAECYVWLVLMVCLFYRKENR